MTCPVTIIIFSMLLNGHPLSTALNPEIKNAVNERSSFELFLQTSREQERIPVGCVPSAAVAVSGGGGVCQGGSVWGGGV